MTKKKENDSVEVLLYHFGYGRASIAFFRFQSFVFFAKELLFI